MTYLTHSLGRMLLLAGLILVSATSNARHYNEINARLVRGNEHYHDGGYHERGDYHGRGGYYGRGGYGPRGYFGGGWLGPNVVINVPAVPRAPYYVRECEQVEVCNSFDECWLERYCN